MAHITSSFVEQKVFQAFHQDVTRSHQKLGQSLATTGSSLCSAYQTALLCFEVGTNRSTATCALLPGQLHAPEWCLGVYTVVRTVQYRSAQPKLERFLACGELHEMVNTPTIPSP